MRAGVLVRLEFPHTERRALMRCGLVECSRDNLTSLVFDHHGVCYARYKVVDAMLLARTARALIPRVIQHIGFKIRSPLLPRCSVPLDVSATMNMDDIHVCC